MDAYRILISRYPTRSGILASPEELNGAYSRLSEKWARVKTGSVSIGELCCSCEDYENDKSSARVLVPNNPAIRDIVLIELGAVDAGELEKITREFNLPFLPSNVRHKEGPTLFNIP